jgi:hypothetical protein
MPQPVELGIVKFLEDYDQAITISSQEKKPIFLLFQEIPGCSTCTNFGKNILSHPLIVEAISSEFIPLVIPNNKPGKPAQILEKYGEPSWNNPVVRFIDEKGQDIIPRADGIYSAKGMIERMIRTLEKYSRPVPNYLRNLFREFQHDRLQMATYSMGCYWEGEKRLGSIEGVMRFTLFFFNLMNIVLILDG